MMTHPTAGDTIGFIGLGAMGAPMARRLALSLIHI